MPNEWCVPQDAFLFVSLLRINPNPIFRVNRSHYGKGSPVFDAIFFFTFIYFVTAIFIFNLIIMQKVKKKKFAHNNENLNR